MIENVIPWNELETKTHIIIYERDELSWACFGKMFIGIATHLCFGVDPFVAVFAGEILRLIIYNLDIMPLAGQIGHESIRLQ